MVKIKKIFIFLLFTVLLINISFALDCEYTEKQVRYEEGPVLYYKDSDNIMGQGLILSGFKEGNRASFFVKNPNNFEVVAHFNYSIGGKVTDVAKTGKRIGPGNSEEIVYFCHIGEGECFIAEKSVNYYITQVNGEPKILIPREGLFPTIENVCKGKNNGSKCSKHEECGCGFCNRGKTCGTFIDCPDGTLDCNNKSCLIPSVKKAGEAYMCEWECKYGGNEGVCNYWKGLWPIFGLFLLLIGGIIVIKIYKQGTDKEKRKAEEAKKKSEEEEMRFGELKKIVRDTKGLLNELNEELNAKKNLLNKLNTEKEKIIQDIKEEKEKSKKKINLIKQKEDEKIKKLELKKENKSIEAEKEIQKEIEKIRSIRQGEIDKINKENEEKIAYLNRKKKENTDKIAQEEARYQDKENEILKKEEEIKERETEVSKKERLLEQKNINLDKTSFETYKKEQLQKYIKRYDRAGIDISYNDKKYFIVTYRKSKKQTTLQRYVYSSYYPLTDKLVVHHIDFDQLNNDIWNLIAISWEDHERLNHQEVIEKDWMLGVEQLKKKLDYGTKEKPLPKHIQKHLNDLEELSKEKQETLMRANPEHQQLNIPSKDVVSSSNDILKKEEIIGNVKTREDIIDKKDTFKLKKPTFIKPKHFKKKKKHNSKKKFGKFRKSRRH
jgi:hypothetical protein